MVSRAFGQVYVAYASEPSGLVSILVDDESLDVAQAAADSASGCPQPCACPPWLQIAGNKAPRE